MGLVSHAHLRSARAPLPKLVVGDGCRRSTPAVAPSYRQFVFYIFFLRLSPIPDGSPGRFP
eukprot:693996-Pleurochrysis_carterae.AAC.1